MPDFVDQTGRTVSLQTIPRRIISTVPSQSELLFDLGLDEEVIGITKFCVHPDQWFRTKTRVGGTKKLNIDLINDLKPDLIIANKEENVKEQIEELEKQYPVWISDVNDIDSAFEMFEQVGSMTGKSEKANVIVNEVRKSFDQISSPVNQLRSCYLIWNDPYMTVGGDTFIHCMMEKAGFKNIFYELVRYPKIDLEDLARFECENILLSSEPYPFKQKHVEQLQRELPDTKILLVDGEMFSWYGSRMLYAGDYFLRLQKQILNH